MSRLRFTTAHEVFDTFPSARGDVGGDGPDAAPVAYLDRLANSAAPDAALAFCAYMLPRREAVWWGCRCLRSLFPQIATAPPDGLKAAEAWVRRPEDTLRRVALDLGTGGDLTTPAPWLALAAGWSGGSMVLGDHPVPAPPHLTAKAVRACLLIALGQVHPAHRHAMIKAFAEAGRRLAEGEETL